MRNLFRLVGLAVLGLASSASAEPLSEFRFTANAAISGYNRDHLTGVTPSQCAAACKTKSWCKSFDFERQAAACDLSGKRAEEVGGLNTDYSGDPYDHYNLSPLVNAPNPIPGDRHLLVIGVDGLRGDALTCEDCAKPPTILELIETGAFHSKVLAGGTQSTLSGPGWATQFTGYWASKHGVTSNDVTLKLKKQHVFSLIKKAYPGATTAVAADWENLTQNLVPSDADFVARTDSSKDSEKIVKDWLGWRNPPAAIFYYMQDTDIHACCYAPKSPLYQEKILEEDRRIKRALDALVARPTYRKENWLIVLVSDHGGKASGHGGQSKGERETPLILSNSYKNPNAKPYCRGTFSKVELRQIDALTPHSLDFLNVDNPTKGQKLDACGS